MRKRLSLATVAALSLVLAACGPTPEEQLERAQVAFSEGRYNDARLDLASVLQDDASNPDALELLVRTQIMLGEAEDALATLERLERAAQSPADAAILAAEAHLQLGETDEVRQLLKDEDRPESWRLLALAAAYDGDEASALEAFARGRESSGDHFHLLISEADFHLNRGDETAANDAVERAREIDPVALATRFAEGRLAQLRGDRVGALDAFNGILERAPTDRGALIGAIAEYGNSGDIASVRPLVARGRESYPGDVEFLYLEARLEAFDEDWQAVRDLLQWQESTIAGHPDARGLYARSLLELGQLEQARAQLAPLYRRHPDNANIARTFAQALIEGGEFERAGEVIAPFAQAPEAEEIDRQIAERAARG